MTQYLLLLPMLIPLIGAIGLAIVRPLQNNKVRNGYTAVITIMTLVSSVFVVFGKEKELLLFYLTEEIPIYFHLDHLGTLYLLLICVVFTCNIFFCFSYLKEDKHQTRYYLVFMLALFALLGASLAGNLITLYLFYEMMTLSTMPFVLHELSKEAIEAAKKYLFYSMGGAFLGLSGFFFFYHYGKTLNFTSGGCLDPTRVSGHETLILVMTLLVIIGFGSKAGMFPLHGWLPTAHPVAPAPASALLSGNITKMGVFVIIRYIYYLIGVDFLRGTFVQYAFIGLALLTILMGSMMAYKENVLKKRLAYSTVSQVAYILFGVALMNPIAMLGALMHIVFHSLVKNTLFLNAGAIITQTGRKKVSELKGIGKEMPVTMWCFTLVSLTLVGIPPTSAFVSKWYLAIGSLDSGIPVISWLGPVILLISALLTAGYLITISMKGFFPGDDYDYAHFQKKEAPLFMTVPMVILTTLAVVIGIFPTGFISFLQTIVSEIL